MTKSSKVSNPPNKDLNMFTETVRHEPPRPLRKALTDPEPFPISALGPTLMGAALAIHNKVQAPLAICAQSVLAVATLVTQPHADVMLPMGQTRPISNYWLSIAGTGERKTTVDKEAMWAIDIRESELLAQYGTDYTHWRNEYEVWEKGRQGILKNPKKYPTREAKGTALKELGTCPPAPLVPMLYCPEPTFEGLCRLYVEGLPSVGLFSSEGGQFIGGHGMNQDTRLKTSAAISSLWDGSSIKKVRAGEGVLVLAGKRLAMHLMMQPGVARGLLSDSMLLDQGLLSRILVTCPLSTAGTRFKKPLDPQSDADLRIYNERILHIARMPFPLKKNQGNELNPRILQLTTTATEVLERFSNHIEGMLGPNGKMEPITGLANKLAEHAARFAAVMALIKNINVKEISETDISAGIQLAEYYAEEALRLVGHTVVSPDIVLAEKLLTWLHKTWKEDAVSLPDIYQRGPYSIGDKATAERIAAILTDHGWLKKIEGGAEIKNSFRRDVWHIVPEGVCSVVS